MRKRQPTNKRRATMNEEFKEKVTEKILAEMNSLKKKRQRRGISSKRKMELCCIEEGMARAGKIVCES